VGEGDCAWFMVPMRDLEIEEAFHEPEGRASSPLRAASCNDDFLQRKGRRARSDAPYPGQPVRPMERKPRSVVHNAR
jgi:hypothetical protein